MMKFPKDLKPFIECLRARGFIDSVKTKGPVSDIHTNFGPLGTLMRQRIKEKWCDVMVQSQSNVFPIECSQGSQNYGMNGIIKGYDTDGSKLLELDCLSSYPQVLKLTNGRLPFSIASIGSCKACVGRKKSVERDFFLGSPRRTLLLLQNYVAPTGSSRVLDYWLQLRLSWWKKYSRNPAHFQAISSSSLDGDDSNANQINSKAEGNDSNSSQNRLSIVYEFPWGMEVVEEVSNLGEGMLRNLPEDQRINKVKHKKLKDKAEPLPHCIQCSTSVEVAMAAWLVDAFHERTPVTAATVKQRAKQRAKRNTDLVLQLHNEIAPYQVAIARDPSSTTAEDKVEEDIRVTSVSDRLARDLKLEGISVFNACTHGASLLAHFRRNDQLGVPYTVILDSETLNNGVVSIRNRDTELQEESHISAAAQKLRKYLSAELE